MSLFIWDVSDSLLCLEAHFILFIWEIYCYHIINQFIKVSGVKPSLFLAYGFSGLVSRSYHRKFFDVAVLFFFCCSLLFILVFSCSDILTFLPIPDIHFICLIKSIGEDFCLIVLFGSLCFSFLTYWVAVSIENHFFTKIFLHIVELFLHLHDIYLHGLHMLICIPFEIIDDFTRRLKYLSNILTTLVPLSLAVEQLWPFGGTMFLYFLMFPYVCASVSPSAG